jgi:large subunit ribosomal protein L29
MKIGEVRDMSSDELHGELERLRRHLFDLRAQAVTEKLANPNQVTKTKRDIARVFTVIRERGITGVEERLHHIEAVAVRQKRG